MNVENFITSVVDKYISLKKYKVPKKEIKKINLIDHEKYIKAKKKLLEIACKMIVIGYEKKEITNITGISNEKLKELESIFNTKIL
ncbi:hypothetical protein ACRRVB_00755 [Candidatus Cardinium hertigii]|uniref:hypothetical protein n=1 Tax=Candidatus Cardinium hertigii TaxID=247481 RepID=UPI003D7D0D9E